MSIPTPDREPRKVTVDNDSITVSTADAADLDHALFIAAMACITALLARGVDSTVEAIIENLDSPLEGNEVVNEVVIIGDIGD